ncbi:MAG: hypothetical protein A3G32_09105 [Deltaproteobacteria bacterium RIFCSPLOWO2_12_FULL_40_28]|nr:MAG: hypothetical protein A3C45_07960 [Deltaproteobacteria bacterium RIFCSPHIGHO2_02_FULL_40_28]OGQ21178.1 MAG: hypothetical protein A3E27_01595 [Deltaproteobacteria bacterium RIFCSPHIGHO2_12_FULL_40_32]OGQ39079.1 MAG: hypothetical protein A3I69_09230 [Deltaproteobacteria bacterium RIFCSPLOWO2_02_FULL_40_36]OGQ53152.1 MAG: hypothetical protein A3G32_09105 [Deltaproteobacteria bacterium RIFCSPLOWO2_12_FULL_40_28]
MTTPNRMQDHWESVKKFIHHEWPLLSETTVEDINGDFDKFLEYLKEYYNNFPFEEAKARNKLQRFINSLE